MHLNSATYIENALNFIKTLNSLNNTLFLDSATILPPDEDRTLFFARSIYWGADHIWGLDSFIQYVDQNAYNLFVHYVVWNVSTSSFDLARSETLTRPIKAFSYDWLSWLDVLFGSVSSRVQISPPKIVFYVPVIFYVLSNKSIFHL